MHYGTSVKIMARLKLFLIAVVVALVSKDGAFSCSLQSHKSHCSSTKTNIISTPHHSTVPKPLSTTLPPCGPSTTSSSCAPNSVPNTSNDFVSHSKPTPSSGTSSPVSVVPPTITASSSYSNILLNLIIKLLTSSEGIGPPVSQKPLIPTTNPTQASGLAKKPCTIPRTCSNLLSSSSSTSSGASSVLPNQPYGLGLPSNIALVPSLPVSKPAPSNSATNSSQTSSVHSDLLNFFIQLLSNVFGTKVSLVSKLKPLSPPCPLFKPALSNDVEIVTPTKPATTTVICTPSFGSNPSSNGMPFNPNIPTKITIPDPAPEEFPEQVPTSNPTSYQAPDSILVPVPTLTSTISDHNSSTIINLLIKCLLSNRAPTGELVSLKPNISSSCSLLTSTINKTSVTSTLKPQTIPASCVTTSGFNSCSSSTLPSLSSISILSPNLTSPSPVPVPISNSGIPSGYNPNFIKHLIKHLLSTYPINLPAPLNTSFPIFHAKINTTSGLQPKPNTPPTSTYNGPLPELSNNSFVVLLNKSYDLSSKSTPSSTPAPIINPNVSTSNNSVLTNIWCKVLSPSSISLETRPSISLKTPPCIPPLISLPIPTLNIPVSPPNLKPLPTIIPCATSMLPTDTVPISDTPSPLVLKPFPEPNQNSNVDTVLKPTSRPHLCHLKHSKHPTPTLSGPIPHIKHILQPHPSSLPLPCSKPSKLGSGCKHLSLV